MQFLMAGIVIACFLFSMGNKPKAYVVLYHLVLSAQHYSRRARWKYKICALIFAVLMVYVIFAAVECSIRAAGQGGAAYRIMLFSIIVTYGSAYIYPSSICATYSIAPMVRPDSVCLLERARLRPLAHVYQLSPVYAPVANLYQHSSDVSRCYPNLTIKRGPLNICHTHRYAFANLDDVSQSCVTQYPWS